ncbi:response regulator transcription factor [Arcobacter arenosus]|uniref:Response regulator transcription factor n=1 Tax=Arcobacter arenosus TaxID=2576037 RepID=A0A5R8Y3B1_9BACT|nr:response regulator transcription factor [Arcobacter arenosus]TLP40607.1 response regulator transcription factor [Arcobacter arenosus]
MSSSITRVLLVEDEDDAREILQFYLDTVFDEVEVASNGLEGLNIFSENLKKGKLFDVIVTDIRMPQLDGLSMLEKITQQNENQKFIIVSAYKDEEYLFRSINLNVISYFVKPLVVENIMEILKKVKKSILEKNEKIEKVDNDLLKINETYFYSKDKKLLYDKDELVNLSKKETLLLDAMICKKGEIITNEYLKKSVWNDSKTSDATLRTVIKRVKDKISKDDFIVSKKGMGYIIE